MAIAIVPASRRDVDTIFELIQSERKYLLYRSKKDLKRHIKNFVVAKDSGDIVGCASFENYCPEIAEIRSMVVLPKYRGKGLGKKLTNTLMKRKLKHQKVFIVTSKVSYFERLGFHNALGEKYVLFKR